MTDKLNKLELHPKDFIVFQDTITHLTILPNVKSIADSSLSDTIKAQPFARKVFDEQDIDSIFRQHEEREKQYQVEIKLIQAKKYLQKIDTPKLFYDNLGTYHDHLSESISFDPLHQNVLFNIPAVKFEENTKKKPVFISDSVQLNNKNTHFSEKQIHVKPRFTNNKLGFDWISLIVFMSIVLLGWIRLFFNNHFFSIIKSASNYQEANSLLRGKNTIIERIFFLLNTLFLLTTSVFALQMAHFYNLDITRGQQYLFFAIVFGSLIGLSVFRKISSSFIGEVFLKQRVFSEYFHNLNIYTMNTGIFLLPIIILLQYLSIQYLGIIIYMGIFGIATLYFIQLIRSFQIIIRKNVSIFYMILYLCAFEFAPFLIVYKLLLSLN